MKFWFDTEFYENGCTIKPISIGVVSEDGREYYAETDEAKTLARKTEWLQTNVLPHLRGRPIKKHSVIATDLVEFMGEAPEIWAYYASYDWVMICQLFGRMIDLPPNWPKYCRDVKQFADSIGNPTLPKQGGSEHYAINDAWWAREAWQFLQEQKSRG